MRRILPMLFPLMLGACGQAAAPVTPASLLRGYVRGIDLSEARGAELAGVQFRDRDGTVKPAAQIAADHHFDWVRVRLMIDPGGDDGKNYALLQDLPYVKAAVKDAKSRGMKVLLDLHYSHWWADPGNQWTPARWKSLSTADLRVAVHDYTADVITQLRAAGAAPDMVQVGNEINGGMLWEPGRIVNDDMTTFASLVNAGVQGVRDAGGPTPPPVMIHIAKIGNAAETTAWYQAFRKAGGQFDVIGLSYYPMWHGDFQNVSDTVKALRAEYPQTPVLLAETAYYWDTNEVGYKDAQVPYPQTPAGQLAYLKDLNATIRAAGGQGIFYWGAAWSQSPRWLTSSWTDDDASRRSLFDDDATATPAIDGLN
ncbi:glycosyl hydrolase 53 family protein [Deinococcus sp. JMULE3]|uniref:glycoside hydrolase family 53 protein n=1 Tax=Deinococcus sp. JMULE3 TaxID=2518341 RepID=UPI0015773F2F|nr:glycosyl hydrolase 53 family protein [Deinococcus sp. JMULE3]NTY01439.1 glycosyl hydrolase family 53 [Deinococcus sp. JMULE3]